MLAWLIPVAKSLQWSEPSVLPLRNSCFPFIKVRSAPLEQRHSSIPLQSTSASASSRTTSKTSSRVIWFLRLARLSFLSDLLSLLRCSAPNLLSASIDLSWSSHTLRLTLLVMLFSLSVSYRLRSDDFPNEDQIGSFQGVALCADGIALLRTCAFVTARFASGRSTDRFSPCLGPMFRRLLTLGMYPSNWKVLPQKGEFSKKNLKDNRRFAEPSLNVLTDYTPVNKRLLADTFCCGNYTRKCRAQADARALCLVEDAYNAAEAALFQSQVTAALRQLQRVLRRRWCRWGRQS